MSKKTMTEGHVAVVKKWHGAGYNVTSAAVASNLGERTVRAIAKAYELGKWGRKSLSQRIINDIHAKADVPPNLEGLHTRFLRMWSPWQEVPLETLQMALGGVSIERLTQWTTVEQKRFKAAWDVQRTAKGL